MRKRQSPPHPPPLNPTASGGAGGATPTANAHAVMKQLLLFRANMGRKPFIIAVVLIEIIMALAIVAAGWELWLLMFACLLPSAYVGICVQKARLNDAGCSGWWILPAMCVRQIFLSPAWDEFGFGVVLLTIVLGYVPTIIMASMPTANPATNEYRTPRGDVKI